MTEVKCPKCGYVNKSVLATITPLTNHNKWHSLADFCFLYLSLKILPKPPIRLYLSKVTVSYDDQIKEMWPIAPPTIEFMGDFCDFEQFCRGLATRYCLDSCCRQLLDDFPVVRQNSWPWWSALTSTWYYLIRIDSYSIDGSETYVIEMRDIV